MRINFFATLTVVLAVGIVLAKPSKHPTMEAKASPDEQQLIEARKATELAQAAAGILGRMAIAPPDFKILHPISSLKDRMNSTGPYFGIAHNDLIMGLLSEGDRFTLLQIRRAIYQIVPRNSLGLAITLINANWRLQTELLTALAEFFVAHGISDSTTISDQVWNLVPRDTYELNVVGFLVGYHNKTFSEDPQPFVVKKNSLKKP